MKSSTFQKQCVIDAPVESVFAWHARPGALERLIPPWDPLTVIRRTGGIKPGAEVVMRIKAGPLPLEWRARHTHFEENRMFRDILVRGPFARWEHTHRFAPHGAGGCLLTDSIAYALPLHPFSTAITDKVIQNMLGRTFAYRHDVTIGDIAAHQRMRHVGPLTILVSGAGGLIGQALLPFLTTGGHQVIRLVRRRPKPDKGELYWDPAKGVLALQDAGPIDAVIHLSGENIGEGRWTAEKKQRIIESRVNSTRLIVETLTRLNNPPPVFLCASAIGYYGNRGDAAMDEESGPGRDFISHVCQKWEAEADKAARAGIRTVKLRIGVVLSPLGGALGKLLPMFKAGIGGGIGDGRQILSWISIDDTVGAIHHALCNAGVSGPVNLVSPYPVTNREFADTLGRVLGRPVFFSVPAAAILAAYGEMGRETILSSTRVRPGVLEQTGYPFRHPGLLAALRHVLGRTNP